MALKDEQGFKFVDGSCFSSHKQDKVFAFKMFVDCLGSGVDLLKRMQVGGNTETSWNIFNRVKRMKDWARISCHVYNIKYCRSFQQRVVICNPRMEQRKLCFGKMLHVVMADSALTYWNVVKKLYRDGDSSLSMVGRECTCVFHWCASLDKVTQIYIKPSLLLRHKKICKYYKVAR